MYSPQERPLENRSYTGRIIIQRFWYVLANLYENTIVHWMNDHRQDSSVYSPTFNRTRSYIGWMIIDRLWHVLANLLKNAIVDWVTDQWHILVCTHQPFRNDHWEILVCTRQPLREHDRTFGECIIIRRFRHVFAARQTLYTNTIVGWLNGHWQILVACVPATRQAI